MSRSRQMARCVVLAALLACASFPVHAVVLTVGPDGNCTHSTVASALAAIPASGFHEVRIATSSVSAQALQITSRGVTLRGGYTSCSAATSTSSSTLSGQGGGQDSVFTVLGAGNDVILENINLIRGDEVHDGYGGGLDFRGAGVVTLRNVGISQNYAGYGGGISVTAQGGPAELRIEAGTVVQLNTAQFSGGGVRIEGDTLLTMIGDNSTISQNEAMGFNPVSNQPQYGFGGGVQVIGPATAYIGSPGIGNGVIVANTARYGGGIAINGGGNDGLNFATVNLYTTDTSRPTRVFGNRATNTGGGVYVGIIFGSDYSIGELCAKDVRIDGNIAAEGSALYLDLDTEFFGGTDGARAYLNNACASASGQGPAPGRVPCSEDDACSTMIGNRTENGSGQSTNGATVLVQEKTTLNIRGFDISGNTGGYTIRAFEASKIKLDNLLIASNANAFQALRVENDGDTISIKDSTIAGNSIGANHVLDIDSDLVLARSIIWQPGKISLSHSGSRSVQKVLASEAGSLGGPPEALVAFPRFVDPENGDFRLRAASPAVDYALQIAENTLDINLALRDKRLEPVPRLPGLIRDLGAYERQSLQPLVLNPDFNTGTGLWQVTTPGVSSWDNTQNAAGGTGSGSIKITQAGTPNLQRVYGLSQCIHLPGPGVYALNGWGRSAAGAVGNRDYVYLNWEYRSAGGEQCDGGTAHASGDFFLSNSASWQRPAIPRLVSSPVNEWTTTSSIKVTMVVTEFGVSSPTTTTGWFDGITLDYVPDDTIFRNGFEPLN